MQHLARQKVLQRESSCMHGLMVRLHALCRHSLWQTTYTLRHNSPWQKQGEYYSAEFNGRCRHFLFVCYPPCMSCMRSENARLARGVTHKRNAHFEPNNHSNRVESEDACANCILHGCTVMQMLTTGTHACGVQLDAL